MPSSAGPLGDDAEPGEPVEHVEVRLARRDDAEATAGRTVRARRDRHPVEAVGADERLGRRAAAACGSRPRAGQRRRRHRLAGCRTPAAAPRPPGTTRAGRRGSTSTVAAESAVSLRQIIPTHDEANRDSAHPARPKSRYSCTVAGLSTGMWMCDEQQLGLLGRHRRAGVVVVTGECQHAARRGDALVRRRCAWRRSSARRPGPCRTTCRTRRRTATTRGRG